MYYRMAEIRGEGGNVMREILFKAKRIDNGEWFYWNALSGLHGVDIDKSTICQYTGLTDKNGNKIWENDIFRVNTKDNYTGKIIFQKGVFEVEWLTDDLLRTDLYFWTSKRAVEVIGNVFDNAELVKE